MRRDLEEKDMIGDLLNESLDNFEVHKKTIRPSNRPPALKTQQLPKPPTYQQKVYSPQLQSKTNCSYDLDLKLQKVLVQQSAPNSALKAKSYEDGLQQFVPSDIISLVSLEGDIISKCKDQNGARGIQKQFEEGDQNKKDLIFNKLEKGVVCLSKDVFGNYVVQNILEFGTQYQKSKIFSILQPHIQQLSFHMYGCRVIQKLLQQAQTNAEFQLIFEPIKGKARELVIDQHGNHVVQKIVTRSDPKICDWILDGIQGQIHILVTNSFGCRIIQKAISIQTGESDKLLQILNEIMALAHGLCISQYGNYIIQSLLKDGPKQIREQIQNIIISSFEEFSLNKFGSNVIDFAIQLSDNSFKQQILQQLLIQKNNQVLFVRLSKNAYGNYVVQNFLKSVDKVLQKELYIRITTNQLLLSEIQSSQFGMFHNLLQGQYVYQMLIKELELELQNCKV